MLRINQMSPNANKKPKRKWRNSFLLKYRQRKSKYPSYPKWRIATATFALNICPGPPLLPKSAKSSQKPCKMKKRSLKSRRRRSRRRRKRKNGRRIWKTKAKKQFKLLKSSKNDIFIGFKINLVPWVWWIVIYLHNLCFEHGRFR